MWGALLCALTAITALAGVPESVSRTLVLFEKTGNEWKIPCASCHYQSLAMLALDSIAP